VPVVVVTVTQGQQAAWRKRHFHSNKRSPSICFPTKNLNFSKIPRYQNSWWNGKNMHRILRVQFHRIHWQSWVTDEEQMAHGSMNSFQDVLKAQKRNGW